MDKILTLSVEETNIIAIYCGESKAETIENILEAIPEMEDSEIVSAAESAVAFLLDLSDEEFAEYDFSESGVYEDDN